MPFVAATHEVELAAIVVFYVIFFLPQYRNFKCTFFNLSGSLLQMTQTWYFSIFCNMHFWLKYSHNLAAGKYKPTKKQVGCIHIIL